MASEQRAWTWTGMATGIANGVFLLAGLCLVVAGTWHAILGAVATATLCLTAGLVFLFAATIDRFESLKGLGMEAKTRQLTETLTESRELLGKLRKLAETSAKTMVELQSLTGRWDGTPIAKTAHLHARETDAMLRELGSSEETIRLVLRPWANITAFDLTMALHTKMSDALKGLVTEIKNERTALSARKEDSPEVQRMSETMAALGARAQGLLSGPPAGFRADAAAHALSLEATVANLSGFDPRVQASLRAIIDPWLPRLRHLAETCDLDDTEAWFAMLAPRS